MKFNTTLLTVENPKIADHSMVSAMKVEVIIHHPSTVAIDEQRIIARISTGLFASSRYLPACHNLYDIAAFIIDDTVPVVGKRGGGSIIVELVGAETSINKTITVRREF